MAIAKKTKSGKWTTRVYTGMKDGKRVYKRITGDSKREVEREASNYLLNQSAYSEVTFEEAARKYISAKKEVLSPNTIRTYNIHLNRLGPLYTVRLSKIDSARVQQVISRLSQDLAPKTVRSTYGFLTAVLSMFSPNTHLKISLPEPEHKEVRIPSAEEVRILIESAQSQDLALAIQLAAFGSLRSGEACALSSDMVFARSIKIARTYVLDPAGTWVIKNSPKTAAGYREIPLPASLMAELRASEREDGRFIKYTPASLHDAFRRLTRTIGLYPYKFHALRHYFATSCHEQGIPDKVIAKIGGWEDVSTLQKIYTHATKASLDQAAEVIDFLYAKSMTKLMTRKTS